MLTAKGEQSVKVQVGVDILFGYMMYDELIVFLNTRHLHTDLQALIKREYLKLSPNVLSSSFSEQSSQISRQNSSVQLSQTSSKH
jgi:hypothetical protein